jgi:hypothetical protein
MRDMPIYYGGALILGAVIWFLCAYLAYQTAGQRQRRPLTWGILGIVFGPIALAAVYLMPKGNLVPATGAAAATPGTAHDLAAHGQTKSQADLYEVPKHKHKG